MRRLTLAVCLLGYLVTVPQYASCLETAAPTGLGGEASLGDRHRFVVEDMLRFCQPEPGFWVDLGAGRGQVALPLIERTENPVIMLDPNEQAMAKGLEIARERDIAHRLFAVVGVAEAMPFPDNSVDLLVSRGSIFFWDDPVQGLREVHRVLRPGAHAYIGGGAGSRFPREATERLVQMRRERLEGPEAERWQRFVELRCPEQMEAWAAAAELPEYTVLGKGAITIDPEMGQGVWLLLKKPSNP